MLKARGKLNGRDTIFLGLSFRNLEKFKNEPLDTVIPIKGSELDIPFDIQIFSGKTEEELDAFFIGHVVKE